MNQVQEKVYAGVYEAVVVGNVDPTGRNLLMLQVPSVFGREIISRVKASMPSATGGLVPEIGDQVWVQFEQGAASSPVWTGTTRVTPDPSSGGGAGGTHFEQNYTSGSTTWTATHNLGYRPAVMLYDPSGNQIGGQVTHNDNTTTTVTFAVPVTGKMTLS